MPEVIPKYNNERWAGGDAPNPELGFFIVGTYDAASAMAALLASVPETYGNIPMRGLPTLDMVADNIWESTVSYGFGEPAEVGDETLSFSTKGGKTKITQSRGTVRFAVSGATAPDYKGAIGVTKDSIEGVEITIPALSFSKTKKFPPEWLTAQRIKDLSDMTGSVNASPIFGFETGELLFEGAEGSQKNLNEPVDVKFDFLASANAVGDKALTAGDITGIEKQGHEYLWLLHVDQEDSNAHALVRRPLAAYVERVFPLADFSALGLES